MRWLRSATTIFLIAQSAVGIFADAQPSNDAELRRQEKAYRDYVRRMPPPSAYLRAVDRQAAIEGRLQETCFRLEVGGSVSSLPVDQCVRMKQPQRIRGIWIDAFEGSQFVAGARTWLQRTLPPAAWEKRPAVWLNTDRVRIAHGFDHGQPSGRQIFIDFIGRGTLYRQPSGHLGMFDYEVIVDRVLSMREVLPQ